MPFCQWQFKIIKKTYTQYDLQGLPRFASVLQNPYRLCSNDGAITQNPLHKRSVLTLIDRTLIFHTACNAFAISLSQSCWRRLNRFRNTVGFGRGETRHRVADAAGVGRESIDRRCASGDPAFSSSGKMDTTQRPKFHTCYLLRDNFLHHIQCF